jgi:hypothetical protein
MRWASGLFLALGLSLSAGAASAGCPDANHRGHHHRDAVDYDRDYGDWKQRYDQWVARYGEPADGDREVFDARRYDRGEDGDWFGDDRDAGPPDARYGQQDDDGLDDRGGRIGYGLDEDFPIFGASPWYRDSRHPAPICDCDGLRLSNSFFYDAGGVGPIPTGGYDGGGEFFVMGGGSGFGSGFAGSSARAFSSASASSSANVNVRFRGGFRGGGHMGGHGGGKH